MTSIPDAELTHDAFLGGRLTLSQPAKGYRAGVDPVLLAASMPARPGQSVLDLGCGAGAALLCLSARVGGLDLAGVEVSPSYAELARINARANGIAAIIHTADIGALPAELRQRRFDHVIANPPYYDRRTGTKAADSGREGALGEVTPLADWVAIGAKRLAPRGMMSVIQRADRLPDLLSAMTTHLGSLDLMPIQPRVGRPASLVIVRGRKGGRTPFLLRPSILMHEGPKHLSDADSFTAHLREVLANAAPLMQP